MSYTVKQSQAKEESSPHTSCGTQSCFSPNNQSSVHTGMALHLLWVPWEICELYLLFGCRSAGRNELSPEEKGGTSQTQQSSCLVPLLSCVPSPSALIKQFSMCPATQCTQSTSMALLLWQLHARHSKPREQHQHRVHRPQQDSTERELGRAAPKCETRLTKGAQCKPPWCHRHWRPSLP